MILCFSYNFYKPIDVGVSGSRVVLAMSSSAVQKLAKPQLRGLFRSYLQKHLTIAIVSGIAGSIVWKFLVMDPRKKAYAEFYKTYDADAEYKRMKEADVLPPFPEID
ncbi:COX6C domain-containing protein [Trichonephila clavata]|uniref:COX6C domain-containing protein n=1 Tax=Trichonephila clavata TaxID=2740835 RepID=A0A8X6G243_TRICU|nr:COX6C domain-containing protein [Trichonephila clavata]